VTPPIVKCHAIGTGMSYATHFADVIGLAISLEA